MKKLLPLLLAGLLMMTSACSNTSNQAGTYTPGSYTGEGQGFGGTVSVTITTDKDKITEVVVAGENETPAIGGAQLETLKDQILAAQSAVMGSGPLASGSVKEAAGSHCRSQGEGAEDGGIDINERMPAPPRLNGPVELGIFGDSDHGISQDLGENCACWHTGL
ncbi:MAG: FMN-binding protein [Holdemania massiliensis]